MQEPLNNVINEKFPKLKIVRSVLNAILGVPVNIRSNSYAPWSLSCTFLT